MAIITNCSDSYYDSWAKVEQIDSVNRVDNTTVELNCTVSLPNPCCEHHGTKINNQDTVKIISVTSVCRDEICTQNIVFDSIVIDITWPVNTKCQLLFQTNGDTYLDTSLTI